MPKLANGTAPDGAGKMAAPVAANRTSCDIVVAGAGLAGKLATAVLAGMGWNVVCCDDRPGGRQGKAGDGDNRVTALLWPSRNILKRAGIWQVVSNNARPLQQLQIVDSGQSSAGPVFEFHSREIGKPCFGWTIRNSVLHGLLDARIAALAGATIMSGARIDRVVGRHRDVFCLLPGAASLQCRLLVAADGRNSQIRAGLGFSMVGPGGGLGALSFNVGHESPNHGITREIYLEGETLTLIPLPGTEHQSSVVWIAGNRRTVELASMPGDDFGRQLDERTAGLPGKLSLESDRLRWPVVTRVSTGMGSGRTILVGEAAHLVPPIGAQGFNMTIADLSALVAAVERFPGDPGSRHAVDQYCRHRRIDMTAATFAVGALGLVAASESRAAHELRGRLLTLLHGQPLLRRGLMNSGLSVAGGLRLAPRVHSGSHD